MIDRNKLESLLGGDEKMVQRFLDIFKTQTPEQMEQLKDSINNKNWDQVSITAHSIKNQCKYLGLDDIASQASNIEQLAEEKKHLDLLSGLVIQLNERLTEIMANSI
jgi:HPt (histidine-containing phosphotransfer) domain-containing protein